MDPEQPMSEKDLGLKPADVGERIDASVVQGIAEVVPQPFQETEETPEQKINAVMNGVREVNSQLGGKVAAEVSLGQGRSTLFFARAFPGSSSGESKYVVYGVDSVNGPIYVSGDLSKKLLTSASDLINFQQASTVTGDEVRDWTHSVSNTDQMNYWGAAFEDSKKAVLRDQREMQRLNEARNSRLDQALQVVSKPIDIGAVAAPRATVEAAAATPVSSAAGK